MAWETPHRRPGSANHVKPQPAAEKIVSWKQIVPFQPSRLLIQQEKDDPSRSHCPRENI